MGKPDFLEEKVLIQLLTFTDSSSGFLETEPGYPNLLRENFTQEA